ncbi:hypothetical protein ACPFMY_000327 [Vibrio cholerae]
MDSKEFVENIDTWKLIANEEGIQLSDNKPLTEEFWAFFIGFSISAYNKMRGFENDKRAIKPYTSTLVRLLDQMSRKEFIKELKTVIEAFVREQCKND